MSSVCAALRERERGERLDLSACLSEEMFSSRGGIKRKSLCAVALADGGGESARMVESTFVNPMRIDLCPLKY